MSRRADAGAASDSASGQAPGASAPRPDRTALRRLELTVRRRIDGALSGEHAGLALGSGSEPEELVTYQPGHDVRRIDWNATARAGGEPQVWLTQAEHALETWVLVDRSPSMAFGTGESEKLDVGLWVAGTLGYLTRGSDRVGLVLADAGGTRWIPPLGGAAAARRVYTEPAAVRTSDSASPLAIALSRFAARAPRRGLRVVITDLIDPDGVIDGPFDWEAPLARLARRHDTVVVEIVDPRELELPDVGQLVVVDPESGRQREIATSSARLRAAYADAAARHRVATASAVRAAGADHLLLRTDDDPARTLARFIRRRQQLPTRNRWRTS